MTLILKRLTMIAPSELEDALVDTLLDMQPNLPGFTTVSVAGHGGSFDQAQVHECVRGRINRLQLWMVLPADDVQRVLDAVGQRLRGGNVTWWIEPVDAMGRLA